MPMGVHRWIGRIFVGSVAAGSVGALYLSVTTTFGWAFGFATMMMNVAWISTTAMAYYAIRGRLIAVHKEWMMRAYAITFAFVIIRLFNDVLPTSQLAGQGVGDHAALGVMGVAVPLEHAVLRRVPGFLERRVG
jgi:uncharacterized membrane protein